MQSTAEHRVLAERRTGSKPAADRPSKHRTSVLPVVGALASGAAVRPGMATGDGGGD